MTDVSLEQHRRQLLSIYQAALRRVNGERAVERYIDVNPLQGEWAVIAIGKAAPSMAIGAQHRLGEHLHSGLVITKYGHADPRLQTNRWRQLESGHPLPDENSLAAGEALLGYLEELPADLPLLFLLSGGASALVESLPERVELDDLKRVNDWLLASGLGIGEMNSIRKRLSLIKGGRLARHLRRRRCLQLLISDVPGDDAATIGSAPLYPAVESLMPDSLPDWLNNLLNAAEPTPDDSSFASIESHIIASNDMARESLIESARELGLAVVDHPGHFQANAEKLAEAFVGEMLESDPGLYLWGGESSVRLPSKPGRGGRNQHLALAAARLLAGKGHCLFLAAGTDGSDGPTEEAGALVDGETIQRGELEGLSAKNALSHADSGHFLEASGDLIETGPTGTNVMDLVIAWSWDAD